MTAPRPWRGAGLRAPAVTGSIAVAAIALAAGCGGGTHAQGAGSSRPAAARTATGGRAPVHTATRVRHDVLARKLAVVTLSVFGLPHATAISNSDGTTVDVSVPAREVCNAVPSSEQKAIASIRHSLPYVKHVEITAAGRPLGPYIAARCGHLTLPTGGGRLVYERNDSGAFDAPTFAVTSSRWTVDYLSDGGTFEVIVHRSGGNQPQVITASKPITGSKILTGPGKFTLFVVGAIGWQIQVREH